MESDESNGLSQLPPEMFSIIKSISNGFGPRLGRLALPGRKVLETPHYLGITSRGVIPHISQDTFARDTSINGVYVALEDCRFTLCCATKRVLTGMLIAEKS